MTDVLENVVGHLLTRATEGHPLSAFAPGAPKALLDRLQQSGFFPATFPFTEDQETIRGRKDAKRQALEKVFRPETLEALIEEAHDLREKGNRNDTADGVCGALYELIAAAAFAVNEDYLAATFCLQNVELRLLKGGIDANGMATVMRSRGVRFAPTMKVLAIDTFPLLLNYLTNSSNRH